MKEYFESIDVSTFSPTVKDQKKEFHANLLKKEAQSELSKQVKQTFPDAELSDVEKEK